MLRVAHVAAIALTLFAAPAWSEAERQITWDDLVPAAPRLYDPVEDVSPEHRQDVLELGWLSELQKSGSNMFGDTTELRKRLERAGVNVDELLQRLYDFNAEIIRRGEMVVGDLDKQSVRLAGYALPLELSEAGVSEFLLVPYVGACIHVPPPPPNQIVLVRVDKAFKPKDLYTPVWVTGRITAKPAMTALSLVDGKGNIHTGYSMDGERVEPYKR